MKITANKNDLIKGISIGDSVISSKKSIPQYLFSCANLGVLVELISTSTELFSLVHISYYASSP